MRKRVRQVRSRSRSRRRTMSAASSMTDITARLPTSQRRATSEMTGFPISREYVSFRGRCQSTWKAANVETGKPSAQTTPSASLSSPTPATRTRFTRLSRARTSRLRQLRLLRHSLPLRQLHSWVSLLPAIRLSNCPLTWPC